MLKNTNKKFPSFVHSFNHNIFNKFIGDNINSEEWNKI